MPIDIVIRVHDEAAAQRVKKFADTVEKESGRAATKMEGVFKKASAGVINATSAMGGSVTSIFASIGGKAGVAALAVTAVATAMTHLTRRAAEAGQTIEAIKFEATLESIKRQTDSIFDSIGERLLPFYNKMFEFWGLAASTSEVMAKATEKQAERAKALRNLQGDIASLQIEISNIIIQNEQKKLQVLQQIEDTRKRELEIIQKTRLELIEDAARRFEAERDFLGAEMAGIEQIGAAIQQMNERLDDDEASQARSAFLDEFEDKGEQASNALREISLQFVQLAAMIDFTEVKGRKMWSTLLQLGFQSAFSFLARSSPGLPLPVLPFAEGGIIRGAANGLMVRKPTFLMVGENSQPEAIVPLSENKQQQRESVLRESGLLAEGGGTIINNININNVQRLDPLAARTSVMPVLNRAVRRGERLLSSRVR